MYEIMIIGGGPSGLAAAVYAARKRLNAVLVSVDIGGQLNWNSGVENYLGYQFITGPELIEKFQSQVNKFPIEQKIGSRVTGLKKISGGFEAATETGEKYQAEVVVIATGKRPKKLNVPGEAQYLGKGVTYCAICDGPLFAGEKVAVIGGGTSALEAAMDMLKLSEQTALISPRPLVGDPILIDRVKQAKNVTEYIGYEVTAITGDEFVKNINIKNPATGETLSLPVAGVFVEIGLEPSSDIIKGMLPLNNRGEIPVSCSNETTEPGLFAAGDVTDVSEKQILIAAGEGAKAALTAHRYLQHLEIKKK
jgi:NADH-dependent peroxiredoxin subunit F